MPVHYTGTSAHTPSQSSVGLVGPGGNIAIVSSSAPSVSGFIEFQPLDISPAAFDREHPFIRDIDGIDSPFITFLYHELCYSLPVIFVPHISIVYSFTVRAFMRPWQEVSEAYTLRQAHDLRRASKRIRNRTWVVWVRYYVDLVRLHRKREYKKWKQETEMTWIFQGTRIGR
jgi:hypothetical protein